MTEEVMTEEVMTEEDTTAMTEVAPPMIAETIQVTEEEATVIEVDSVTVVVEVVE